MFLFHIKKSRMLPFWVLACCSGLMFSACNKDLEKAVPIPPPTQASSPTIADLLNDPNYSILKAAVVKAGMLPMLADASLRLTVFAPDNAAFAASGISLAVINALPVSSVAGLVGYHIVPQLLPSASIPTSFPNLQYPTMVNPAPSLSAFLRLTTFPSKRGTTSWVNNVPIIAADIAAVNGFMHKVPVVVAPPSADLWSRISTDPNLTYLLATINRADSGVAAGGRLQDALNTSASASAIAANLTIFAPNDAAMKSFLTGALTQAFIANGIPPTQAQLAAASLVGLFGAQIISNPASIPDVPGFPLGIGKMIAAVLTPTLAKGVVVYHILSSQSSPYLPPGIRAFSVNLPATATALKTLLNSAVAVHPGITVQATFGATGVTAISVKGAANPTAANVLINPLPSGTSDQHYVNGVMHVIDQVLLPQ
jgi:uncharacterized surface protein with fasciclin (FAS1) repeats